jgi:cyanophycin synthetase
MRKFGELAASIFDRIVIREDGDTRGRASGEIAAVLYRAVLGAGTAADRVSVMLNEIGSVHAAIDLAQPGDLVVALIDDVPGVWKSLKARMNRAPVAADAPEATADMMFVPPFPIEAPQPAL